ncbi:mitochondrial (zinc or iron) ion transmembrane transporter Mmt1 [Schizosaccharomyces osmophilus]|uniref:Mitochondrial (Zinc or iron) ion transmembrane transporter Mmt1 n=1 Tax=Schizosaccharomyces osmophilus TaxID=2545709 RepID=A0AAF0B041_9SCHI|nr:mitochondrial (zinc or iron) ion transmembrane transporter Mmt1 [Schizosaccharomyces osmophilus]WBW75589.1 mitochondrial (zinc or iron) ion transmembrane transporter Mmt1 [Schizosaccharomyces osmophilus]
MLPRSTKTFAFRGCFETSKRNSLRKYPSSTYRPWLFCRQHGLYPHTHKHTHEDDKNYVEFVKALKQKKQTPEVRMTWWGLYSNIALMAAKGTGGLALQSNILLADAAHQLGDMISDLVTLFTLKICNKKPTRDYPTGYGKWETLGTFSVSGLLLAVSVGIANSSFSRLYTIFLQGSTTHNSVDAAATNAHLGHSHDYSELILHHPFMAMGIAFGSIVLKEWLFQRTKEVARATSSNLLMANAWHHRADALTGLASLAALSGAYLLNAPWLDPLFGCLVSIVVFRAGFASSSKALHQMLDKAPSTNLHTTVVDVLSKKADFPHKVAMTLGNTHAIHVILSMAPDLTIQETSKLVKLAEDIILDAMPALSSCIVTPLSSTSEQIQDWKKLRPVTEHHEPQH